jgi:hypothetical protein
MFGVKGQNSLYPYVAKKHVGEYKHYAGKGIHQIPHSSKGNILGFFQDTKKSTNHLEKAK